MNGFMHIRRLKFQNFFFRSPKVGFFVFSCVIPHWKLMSNVIRRFSVFSSVFHRVFRNFLKNGKFCWKLQELEEMHKKSTIYCFLLFHWLTLFRLFFSFFIVISYSIKTSIIIIMCLLPIKKKKEQNDSIGEK